MNPDESTTPDGDQALDQDPGAGSGDGGSLGTPGGPSKIEPPSTEQDTNEAVSGGGMVQPDAEDYAEDNATDRS